MWSWFIAAALASDWEFSGELGGEFNADSHGIANVRFEGGPWQLSLITDTLDVRYQPSWDRGRAWVGARLATFAAGMVISPWVDGAPAPELAMSSLYGGVEGGALHYGPAGTYVGGQGFVHYHTFYARDALPPARLHVQAQAVFGIWREELRAWAVAGADVQLSPGNAVQTLSPHARGELVLSPAWVVAPQIEVRAGWGEAQDIVTRTRLGGLNPYVVPLAGAAWAEWWVEDYAAGRLGVTARTPAGDWTVFGDAAVFDGEQAVGFGIRDQLQWRRLVVDGAFGWAPWLERQPGIGSWSVYLTVGLSGVPLGRRGE